MSEPAPLAEWPRIVRAVTSELTEVECLRTIDRLRSTGRLSPDEAIRYRSDLVRLLEGVEVVAVSRPVLRRAGQAFAFPVRTLDALHRATALGWRDRHGDELVMATHDTALGIAASHHGLTVIGVRTQG